MKPADRPCAKSSSKTREILNKVPAITIFFWIVKVLCTTVGETAADYLNTNLHLGLNGTTVFMSGLLLIALVCQLVSSTYVPACYWIVVVLISVVGTLITDNLTDNFGVSLVTTTIVFSIALIVTFATWYLREKTLSVRTITTISREAFYWTAILLTFALGTASGDLIAEQTHLGYLLSAAAFMTVIAIVTFMHMVFKTNAVLSFWLAYILTRPLGTSLGDYLSQPITNGGLGLGTVGTSVIFLTAILITVIYLTISKEDVIALNESTEAA